VLAEPVQTVMRRHGLPDPYEQLKDFTRGKPITREADARLSSTAGAAAAERERLKAMTPASYTGPGGGAALARRIWAGAAENPGLHAMRFTEQLAAAQRATTRCCAWGWTPSRRASPAPGEGRRRRASSTSARHRRRHQGPGLRLQAADRLLRRPPRRRPARAADGHIRRVAPDVPVILDAKRGDIGATAEQYAREAFERYQADAVTLSPFMGFDSIEPYLRYDGKGLFLLCRTSNPGGSDLQAQRAGTTASLLYEHIARWPPAPGTATASSAWWWAPPTRARSNACASWRRRCRC
jgi:hypothetical protein